MANVPISIYPYQQSTVGNIGNALDGLGNTALQGASMLDFLDQRNQAADEKKRKDDLSKAISDILKSDSDATSATFASQAPADLYDIEGGKSPQPYTFGQEAIKNEFQSPSLLNKEDLGAGGISALAPTTMAKANRMASMTQPTHEMDMTQMPPEINGQSALSPPPGMRMASGTDMTQPPGMAGRGEEFPPLGPNQIYGDQTPFGQGLAQSALGGGGTMPMGGPQAPQQDPHQVLMTGLFQKGIQQIAEKVPHDEIMKVMGQYQQIAQKAAELGFPEIALQFASKKLDYLAKMYGADETTLREVIRLQQQALENEKNRTSKMDQIEKQIEGMLTGKRITGGTSKGEKDLTFKERFLNKFNSDKVVQKANEMKRQSGTILDIVAAGNPIGDASVPTFMARASGEVGNLSEADKAPFGGSRAFKERFLQVTKNASEGKLTDDNREFVRGLASIFSKRADADILNRQKYFVRTYGRVRENIPESELADMLIGGADNQSQNSNEFGGTKNPQNEIIRQTKATPSYPNGRKAAYDATTKGFIRWLE